MKFEVLKQSHLKRNITLGVIAVLIISAIILNFTRAKYRVTQSIPLVNGTINYSLADLNVVAIVVDGEKVDTIPTDGYYDLTEKSYCTINGEDVSITLDWNQDTQTLSIIPFATKGTKCYLDFQAATTKEVDTVLGTIVVNLDTPNFSKTSCTSKTYNGTARTCGEETVGIYEETTSKGTTYYYRGDVENNYLVFADKYWRIIRINEDGTIRIIYNGEKSKVDQAGKETVLKNGYDDSSTQYTQIETSEYNNNHGRSEYVGYTYSEDFQRPSDNPSGETESNIKEVLDNWYSTNIGDSNDYDSKVVSNPGFCNDREMASGYEWSSQQSSNNYYAAYERLVTNKKPTFECSNERDIYQTKIGLITADEISYAGGRSTYTNYGYYLYTGNEYWTISPSSSFGLFTIWPSGAIYLITQVTGTAGIRPVINLASNNTITGSGTISDPYVVE